MPIQATTRNPTDSIHPPCSLSTTDDPSTNSATTQPPYSMAELEEGTRVCSITSEVYQTPHKEMGN